MRELQNLLLASYTETGNEYSRNENAARISPFVWLNLICLDAPIVAITWQGFFARSFHVSLTASSRAALFTTAWLIYLIDRLADAWSLDGNEPRSLRQQFCQRHRSAWLVAIGGLTLVDLWIISRQLDRATVQIGMAIGAISLLYLGLNYWLGKIWRFLPVKEICIGCLFAIGTLAALLPRVELSATFVAAFVFYTALCSWNCISIAVWECDLDRAQRKNSIATHWNGVRLFLKPGAFILAVFAIGAQSFRKELAPVCYCIGISAALLGVLDSLGEIVRRDERTALADLVLLTPLFLLLVRNA
jgi:hypothetical protein